MKTWIVFAAVLFCGCWGKSFPGWDATDKAGFERMAAAKLGQCRKDSPCLPEPQKKCFADSNAYCLDAGYSMTCAQSEYEYGCGSQRMFLTITDGGTFILTLDGGTIQ